MGTSSDPINTGSEVRVRPEELTRNLSPGIWYHIAIILLA